MPPQLPLPVDSKAGATPTMHYSGADSICDPLHMKGATRARLPSWAHTADAMPHPTYGHLQPQGSDFFAQEHLPEHQEGTKGCFLKWSLGSQAVSLSQLQKAQALEGMIFKGYNEEMGRRPQTNYEEIMNYVSISGNRWEKATPILWGTHLGPIGDNLQSRNKLCSCKMPSQD